MITAISPIDGRYAAKVSELKECFSEYALIRNRVKVEILWLCALCAEEGIPECPSLSEDEKSLLDGIVTNLTPAEAEVVKGIEAKTNHDVKAVEYYLKAKTAGTSLESRSEFIHFACTSEDINNLAHALMLKDGLSLLLPLQARIIDRRQDSPVIIQRLYRRPGVVLEDGDDGEIIDLVEQRLHCRRVAVEVGWLHQGGPDA